MAAVTIQLELSPEQVEKVKNDYGLSDEQVQECLDELAGFAKTSPLDFCDQNNLFDF
jgi:uncharacterized protein (DUF433 family)